MSTELRDQLADLANRSADVPSPPPDLWQRGIRRRRRSRVLQVACVLAVGLVAGLLPWTGPDPEPPPVDGTGAAGAIPSRLVTPPTRLGDTADHPIGPLAVIAGAERGRRWWFGGSANGTVAVSAVTGEYRFLDLPAAVEPDAATFDARASMALSPDGRSVAYWVRHPDDPDWVGGWAVYDTVSGDVVRHAVASQVGLDPRVLAWSSDLELVVGYGVVTERGRDTVASTRTRTVLWDLTAPDRASPLPRSLADVSWVATTRGGFAALVGDELGLWTRGRAQPDYLRSVVGRREAVEGSVSPDLGSLVLVEQPYDGGAERLLVGRVRPTGVGLATLAVGLRVFDVLGWSDATHVVVRASPPGSPQRTGAYAVDVGTGEHRLLVREDRLNWIGSPRYATDLWARPTVPRPEPDGPTPWWVYAGGASGLLLGAWGVRRWRRGGA